MKPTKKESVAVTPQQLHRWFGLFNRKYFRGQLKRPWMLRFGSLDGKLAATGFFSLPSGIEPAALTINRRIRWSLILCLEALLHEMMHMAHPHAREDGATIKAERRRLVRKGAFDGIL